MHSLQLETLDGGVLIQLEFLVARVAVKPGLDGCGQQVERLNALDSIKCLSKINTVQEGFKPG